jgi:hypothetical protein
MRPGAWITDLGEHSVSCWSGMLGASIDYMGTLRRDLFPFRTKDFLFLRFLCQERQIRVFMSSG